MAASASHLDLSCAPCVLYGIQYFDPVFSASFSGREISDGTSKANSQECDVVVDVVSRLLHGGLLMSEIGIVTPYGSQVPPPFYKLLHRMSIYSRKGKMWGRMALILDLPWCDARLAGADAAGQARVRPQGHRVPEC